MSSPTPQQQMAYAAVISSKFSSIAGTSSGPPSESLGSEISSVESDFSDMRTIAAGLGITEQEEIYTERFKIDRSKLEDMLKCKLQPIL